MSVNDIKDEDLLSRAVRECRHGKGRAKVILWSKVSERFALGCSYSIELCQRFGLNPDEMVRER